MCKCADAVAAARAPGAGAPPPWCVSPRHEQAGLPQASAPGLLAQHAGWADIRLLAPRAELRLLLTGNASLIDSAKLSFLGEAVRAMLVLEMRGLTVSGLERRGWREGCRPKPGGAGLSRGAWGASCRCLLCLCPSSHSS